MRGRTLLVLAVSLLTAAVGLPQKQAAEKDEDKIQGEWSVAVVERDGQPVQGTRAMRFVFAGDKLKRDGREQTFKLDTAKKPKELDLLENGKPVQLGIYELDGVQLKIGRGKLT